MEKGNLLLELINTNIKEKLSFFSQFKFEVISCNYFMAQKPWQIDPRVRPDTFFMFPMKNKVRATIDRQSRIIDKNYFAFSPQGITHTFRMPKDSDQFEFITVHAFIQNPWGLQLAPFFNKFIFKNPLHPNFNIQLKKLRSLLNYDTNLAKILIADLIKELFLNLILSEVEMKSFESGIDPRIIKALQILHENYSHSLSIQDVALESQLSVAQFRRLFKEFIGISPKTYLNNYRIERAASLLRSTSLSIKQIAFQVGYQDEHYFHNVFKRFFGLTPRQYQAQEQQI
ncbi:MAG: hypothetical protein COA79_19575 [Planctomycetota bacterium]|nr:MAG: hypothetical protein COA79_19575 [Planctomycetota bacterium]